MKAGKFVSAVDIYKRPIGEMFPCYGGNGLRGYTKSFNQEGIYSLIGRQGALCGNVTLVEGKFHATEHAVVVTPENSIDSSWMYYLLVHLNLNQYATGAAQPGLSIQNLEQVETKIPTSKAEQEKISALLTLLDERIETQSKIIENLESQMKVLLKGIFSRKYRFTDMHGLNFSDWRFKKLSDISQKRTLKNKSLKVTAVFTNSATEGIMNQRDFFDRDIANKNNIHGYYIVEKDDFIYNPRISKEAPVGPVSRNSLGEGIMSPLYMVFRFQQGNVDFIEYFYKTNIWHDHMSEISNFGARSDRMSFSTKDFFEMPIPFPHSKEQELVAKFLDRIKEQINIEKSLLSNYHIQKDFLMRNLFI